MAWRYLLSACLFWSAHGIVPEPQNVNIHSVTFNSTLQWDPPSFHTENVTYTVQYKQHSGGFIDLCTRIVFTQCSVSSLPLYGNYIVRVRTQSEKEQSNWKNITFIPMDTIIGPPVVHVEPRSRALYVEVKGPFLHRNNIALSIEEFYGTVVYNMLIWKENYGEQMQIVNKMYDSEILSGLDPWTTYCIQVQAFLPNSNKTGEWSKIFCYATNGNGINPLQLAVGSLSGLIVIIPCCLMSLYVYRRVKYVFHPSYSLPQHFKEFLSKPFYSSQSLASQGDYSYETITVVTDNSKNYTDESEEQLNNAKHQYQNSKEIPEAIKLSDRPLPYAVQTEWYNTSHSGGTLQCCS